MKRNKILSFLSALGMAVALYFGIVLTPKNPSPTPSPTVAPTVETPSPEPSAFPTPAPAECVPAPILGECEDHPLGGSIFREAVQAAQAEVEKNRNFVVDGFVMSELEYTAEVARVLSLAGYCSKAGLADEVWVKSKDNTWSDHFDLVTSDLSVWFNYAAKCIPARF